MKNQKYKTINFSLFITATITSISGLLVEKFAHTIGDMYLGLMLSVVAFVIYVEIIRQYFGKNDVDKQSKL